MAKQSDIKRLKSRNYDWPIPWPAVELTANSESFATVAYRCPAGIWTYAWGETDGVKPGDRITPEEGDRLFLREISKYADAVLKMCKIAPTPNQLGALVSLAYNIGLGSPKDKRRRGLYHSSLLRAHNAGKTSDAARAFHLYNKAKVNGVYVELPGLVTRRAAESALYLTPEEGMPETPLPQAVEPESSLLVSPINASGAAMAGGGVLTLLSQYSDAVAPMITTASNIAESLKISPMAVVAALCVVAGAVSMYYRYKQRATGRA